jgi:hypothetical protein
MKLEMSDSFHKWLIDCPCEAYMVEIEGNDDTTSVTYHFVEPVESNRV